MPDFMEGLSDGIEKSRSLFRGAVSDVAGDMVISPQMASMQGDGGSGGSSAAADTSLSGILSGIRETADTSYKGLWEVSFTAVSFTSKFHAEGILKSALTGEMFPV